MNRIRNFLIGIVLNKTQHPNMVNWGNTFNFGEFLETQNENKNFQDKFKNQIAAFKQLKEKRNA